MTELTLREQQSELTRDLIMEALVGLVSEEGAHDFSVQRVADLAGVSHRTVYRHFPSREALLEGLAVWLDERAPMDLDQYLPDRLPEAARDSYRHFEADGERVRALVVLATGARIRVPRRAQHTSDVVALTAPLTAHLPSEDAHAVALLLRTLVGSHIWFQLRDEHRLDGEQAARVAEWAVRTLVDALGAGGGPGMNDLRKEEG